MRNTILTVYVAMLSIYPNIAFAEKVSGFKNEDNVKTIFMTETIEKVKETKSEFLILFSRHVAFYSFPRTEENQIKMRQYFQNTKNSKKTLNIEIHPMTANIISLEDASVQKERSKN